MKFEGILARFRAVSTYMHNKMLWGLTQDFREISAMVWRNLSAEEPDLWPLGDTSTEQTADAMDKMALRPKGFVALTESQRKALKERQLARGTGQNTRS